ncbi:MAG: T9SS type A sorting domain-containing protein [Calditrichaeota bacterium]|nr:T9SS type A sorting domain-containing protein [Calditrichota bacterium]
MVFYSAPAEAEAGKWYMISSWIKTEGINTDTMWYPTNVIPDRDNNRIGVCFFFHKSPIETSWNLVGGDQFFYIDQRRGHEDSDWTLYAAVAQAPEEAAGVSMRARYTSFPTGKTWWDDFAIQEIIPLAVSVDDPSQQLPVIATDYRLSNNYPNPFNPTTVIEYTVPKAGKVNIAVYDVLGRKVRTLVNQNLMPGTYNVVWDGTDDAGERVTTGVYFYQMHTQNAVITKKMTFIK